MVIRTREKLIEVARQLFLKKGVENTTMNDIAEASEKGRRTIYTYFKNKKEIYNAVIEQQSDNIVMRLRDVACLNESPLVKLEKYLYLRLSLFDDFQKNDKSAWFTLRDNKRVGRVHRLALEKERNILKRLMAEGVECGEFDREQAQRFLWLEGVLAQGADYAHMHSLTPQGDDGSEMLRTNIIKFILQGIASKNLIINQ